MKRTAIVQLLMARCFTSLDEDLDLDSDQLRRLQYCAYNEVCCQADYGACKVCTGCCGTIPCSLSTATYQSTFPADPPTEKCSGWGKCGPTLDCREPKLFTPPVCTTVVTEARETGTYPVINAYTDIMSRDDTVGGDTDWQGKGWICPTQECRLKSTSGVDHNKCLVNENKVTGHWEISTDDADCLIMGAGGYRLECTNTIDIKDAIKTPDDCININIIDFCQAPLNTITPLTYGDLSYEQYTWLGTRTELPDLTSFFTIANPNG